jgi:uncharacterized membrane protein YbaN (DUF454 family)
VRGADPRALRLRKARHLALAVFFFIVGVIGVLVPIMPQVPFFVMSALFLALVFPSLRRKLWSWKKKYPKFDASYRKWRTKARQKRREKMRRRRAASPSES